MSGITNPAEAFFKDGSWSWDGSVWRKQPLVWGYSEPYVEQENSDDVAAGSHSLYTSAVDPGEVWVITTVHALNYNTVITQISLIIVRAAAETSFYIEASPPVITGSNWSGKVVLAAGDKLSAWFKDCALNDDIELVASGYKMKVAE